MIILDPLIPWPEVLKLEIKIINSAFYKVSSDLAHREEDVEQYFDFELARIILIFTI
jgi:hypothetical protein